MFRNFKSQSIWSLSRRLWFVAGFGDLHECHWLSKLYNTFVGTGRDGPLQQLSSLLLRWEEHGHHPEGSKGSEKDFDVEEQRRKMERKAKAFHAVQQKSFLCAIVCCLPLGIAALAYSVKARDSLVRGDHLEHGISLKKSNLLLKFAYQIGLMINIFLFGGILTAIILLAVQLR
eukprot:Em0020g355a